MINQLMGSIDPNQVQTLKLQHYKKMKAYQEIMGVIYLPIEETGPRISGSQEYDIMKDIDIV